MILAADPVIIGIYLYNSTKGQIKKSKKVFITIDDEALKCYSNGIRSELPLTEIKNISIGLFQIEIFPFNENFEKVNIDLKAYKGFKIQKAIKGVFTNLGIKIPGKQKR